MLIIFLLIILFNQEHNVEPPINFNQIVKQYRDIGRAVSHYYPKVLYNSGPGVGMTIYSSPGMRNSVDPFISKDSLMIALDSCSKSLDRVLSSNKYDNTIHLRAEWIKSNIRATKFSIKQTEERIDDFDTESIQYFGVQAPVYDEQFFKDINKNLEKMLPGKGTTKERFISLSQRFVIPKDKIDTIMKTIIGEARKRTKANVRLPEGESISLKYTSKVSFQGSTFYSGNNKSVILINTEFPIGIYTAIGVICHEAYPGHHVYNLVMDRNKREKGWDEMNFSLVFGPQGFMSEAIPSFGMGMIFSNEDLMKFAKEVLLPIARIDTTGFNLYSKIFFSRGGVSNLSSEISRRLIKGTLSEDEAISWEINYGFLTKEEALYAIENCKNYRSRIISYNYGVDLIRKFVNKSSDVNDKKSRWKAYYYLLNNPLTPTSLENVITSPN